MKAGLEPDDPYRRIINATEISNTSSIKTQLTMC